MKNIIYTLFFTSIFYLTSCQTLTYKDFGIDEKLWTFATDIMKNPDKLLDLKKYYPDLYDEKYIGDLFSENEKDTAYINRLISYIKNDFPRRSGDSIIRMSGFNPDDVELFKKHIKYQVLTQNELYGFGIEKRGQGVTFEFIKIGNKYYTLRIGKYTMYIGNSPKYDD